MKDLKYFAAYIIPVLAIYGLLQGGYWAWSAVIFAFGFIPILEPLLPSSTRNVTENERNTLLGRRLFDWLLYLNVPIVYAIIALFVWQLPIADWTSAELTGQILSVGIVLGACGINVGHELGHRSERGEQLLAKLLLLPSFYTHFFIEHNRGHHKNVATDLDPASARRGEMIYTFWIRSVVYSYLSAWRLETKRLEKSSIPFWTWQNEMLRFTLAQLAYLTLLVFLLPQGEYAWVALAGIIGFLLLETINYIEHYGLRRKQLASGRYERVRPMHSWNSNAQMGRIVLYELTRHSDHHFIANKKYQILDHHEEAPELPYGYPSSMLMALVPPLWFAVMNRRIPDTSQAIASPKSARTGQAVPSQ